MKGKHLHLLIALLLSGSLHAQQTNVSGKIKLIPGLPNLTIGDQLPNFVIPKVINFGKTTARTADFKDQLLIIDFWSIYCSGCIAALPKMEALQKQFGKKIMILPVTYEPKKLVTDFWKKNRTTKNLTLAYVVEDQIFNSYFRHQAISHEVWIYKGKVIGITGANYVDEHNIKKILEGQEVNWPIKNDFYAFDGTKQPLFEIDTNQVDVNNTSITYAAISDYKEGVNSWGLSGGSGIVRDAKRKTIRAFFLNQPIYTSYSLFWNRLKNANNLVKPRGVATPNEIIWEVSNKSRFFFRPDTDSYMEEWIRKNGICFESQFADTGQTNPEIYKKLITNLNHLLGLNVRWEKRKEKVLILKQGTENTQMKSKIHLLDSKDKFSEKQGVQQFRDLPLSVFVYKLNQQEGNPYVFDESNYKNNVDMDLYFSSWTDLPSIRKAIAVYGLELKEEVRLVDKLVFTEIDGGLLINRN